jgi:drug/metabolite transporter (DMT)-like permease
MNIPLWLSFALASPAFWAIVHVLDSHCVSEVFQRPWVGIITGAMATMAALPFLAIGLAVTPVESMEYSTLGWCIVCGVLFLASQYFYFESLSISESGIVAAYWNFIPVVLMAVGLLFYGEVLTIFQYLGAAIILLCAVAFCVLDGTEGSRWSSFFMMLIASSMQVAYFLIQKEIFAVAPVYQSFLVISLSIALSGVFPLLIPKCRRIVVENWPHIKPLYGFFFAIEIANLIGIGTSQYAVHYGTPSLVSLVESSVPAYTFVLSLLLFAITRKYGEEEAKSQLVQKLFLVFFTLVGIRLLS